MSKRGWKGALVALGATLAGWCALGAPAAVATHPAAATCPGRTLLSCSQKQAIFGDELIAAREMSLEIPLFELSLPLHLGNSALSTFWRFQASAAGVLTEADNLIINQLPDPDFEQVAKLPKLPRLKVTAHGIVDRRTARAMNSLMADEQTEVLNLNGTLTSLDRATGASFVGSRADWVAYQDQLAGAFARRAARAVTGAVYARRAVAASFQRLRLRFGVGAVDLRLTRAAIRRHGLPGGIVAGMRRLGLPADAVGGVSKAIAHGPDNETVSLTAVLGESSTLTVERTLAAALVGFAAGAPHGLPMPS
jgi:hypothetical protein